MPKRTEFKARQDELKEKLPTDARTVLVRTEKGELKYRLITELGPTDSIQVNQDDIPITMKGKAGRPLKVTVAPINAVVAELVKRKKETIEQDAILGAMQTNPEDADVLHQVVIALGVEAASLEFERLEAEREGRETSNISIRRINALKAVADTWLKRRDQIISRGLDMNSPAFKAIFHFLLETFKEAMQASGERPEIIEAVFTRLHKAMTDGSWETEAKSRMKNVI